ncbi:MAG: type 4a pilus biogenesis protein PilO [Pseudomonadota bacterium]
MQLEELVINYKRRKPGQRLAAVIGVGLLLPALWGWISTDIGAIEGNKTQATSEKTASESELQKFIEQKKDAPRLEERLKFTENEMADAKKRLPSEYFIDLMIQKLGVLANKAKVSLKLFNPGEEAVVQGQVPYVEMPIKVKVSGGYNEIAQFYDAIVHFDSMIHIRNMEFNSATVQGEVTGPSSRSGEQNLDVSQKFEKEVRNHQVEASMQLVLFRSMKPDESFADHAKDGAPPPPADPSKPGSKKSGAATPPPPPMPPGKQIKDGGE